MTGWAWPGVGALVALPLLLGCGEDEPAPTAPLVPPTLQIAEIKSTADSWVRGDQPAELKVGCDPKRVVGVLVGPSTSSGLLENFALKPPE